MLNVGGVIAALESLRVGPSEGAVHLLSDGHLAEVVLDNPGARHALSLGMMIGLARAVQRLHDGPEVAVILRSAGGTFCAGGDLREVRSTWGHAEAGRVVAQAMGEVLDALLQLPQAVVVALEGPAIGGGAELSTAGDHRVVGPGGLVAFRQVALGVACGWGGARRLGLHLPGPVAARWLLAGEPQDAAALVDAGYASAAPDAVAGARAWLAPILGHPPEAVRAVKRQLAASRTLGDRAADVDAFVSVWGGPAHRRALGLG